ncbi:DUF2507 domain-containing protein [Pseudogracilibacillus sp. SO30301A]|uniref:DUF2507 domain-containing protein n=1 Tax=Pseudogracilibacillus sp. SO30301A TaxID=3098291 RepID=UPI00300DF9D9
MDRNLISLSTLDEFNSETIGQDILRYISLPSFLGHERDTLLYFIGRNLARKIHIGSFDDVIYLFKKFRWGNLELIKDKKNHMILHLMSDDIVKRMQASIEVDFRLEAGFIAEAMQNVTGRPAECTETVNERLFRVEYKLYFTD